MEEKRRFSPFMPLMLSLALVAGLFIGRSMEQSRTVIPTFLLPRGASSSEKIGQVLDLIDRQYVDTVRKGELVEEVIQDLLQHLDPHSYYISAKELHAAQEPLEGSFEGIGVEFAIQRDTVVVIAPVEGGPSATLGIRAGDRIVSADAKPMAGIGITSDQVMEFLRGPGGSEVTVGILRRGNSKPFDVRVARGKIPINSVAVSLLLPDATGYIKVVRFARTTHEEFLRAAEELKGKGMQRLVVDLRGNGGGYLNAAIDLADEFLPGGRKIVYTEGRTHPRQDYLATSKGILEQMPLAILIDEGSASASEILAGAVQDNDRGLIVGRRSFGKGLVQEHLNLPDESAVRLTTARYYTPSGRSIQRPYGDGIDYNEDFEARFDHGELLSQDSISLDSSKIYHTLAGRTVFGGGGIMPDVFVPADTTETSRYLTELFFSGALNQFAFDLADRDREELEGYGSVAAFRESFQVDHSMLDALSTYAAKDGIREQPSDRQRSGRTIGRRLKAGVARNIWGAQGYYGLLLDDDSLFLRARERLIEAP